MPSSSACDQTKDCAARADSFITSPSWPVSRRPRPPGSSVASTYSTSPPASVQARPVATPAAGPCANCSGRTRSGPSRSARSFGADRHRLGLALGEAPRHLAGDAAQRALQLAHARLARVTADDVPQRLVGRICNCSARQAGLLQLPREQIALGDLDLLLLAVAGQPQNLHAVQQRPRDRVERVRRRDEEHLRQIERQIEIVVAERVVLRRVEDLQQGRGRDRRENRGRACRPRRASAPGC